MRLLHKFSRFTSNKAHLIHIYKSQVRGNLEYCSTVWHSGLSESDTKDIERVQKAAVRIIMGNKYQGYEQALKFLKLDSLKERRVKMALTFAKRSLFIVAFCVMLYKNVAVTRLIFLFAYIFMFVFKQLINFSWASYDQGGIDIHEGAEYGSLIHPK